MFQQSGTELFSGVTSFGCHCRISSLLQLLARLLIEAVLVIVLHENFQAGSEIIVLWEKEKGNPRHSCFCGHSVLELITRIGGWVVLSLLFSFISF